MAFSVADTHQLDKPILLGLQDTSSNNPHPVGYKVTAENGAVYQLVKCDTSGVSVSTGAPVVWQSTTSEKVVTPDLSEQSEAGFAGVACAAADDSEYFWIQTEGKVPDAKVSTGVSADDPLYVGTTDGIFETGLTTDNVIVAVALEDDTTGAANIELL